LNFVQKKNCGTVRKRVLDCSTIAVGMPSPGLFDLILHFNEQSCHHPLYTGGAGDVLFHLNFVMRLSNETFSSRSQLFKVVAPGKGFQKPWMKQMQNSTTMTWPTNAKKNDSNQSTTTTTTTTTTTSASFNELSPPPLINPTASPQKKKSTQETLLLYQKQIHKLNSTVQKQQTEIRELHTMVKQNAELLHTLISMTGNFEF